MRPILIEFFSAFDPKKGRLTAAEGEPFQEAPSHIPFEIKRLFWIDEVPFGEWRGGHAHRTCEQILIALAGSFNAVLNQGESDKIYRLSDPTVGLYVPAMTWIWLTDWIPGSICLCIASDHFYEWDYIRNWESFREDLRIYKRAT